MGQEIQAAHFHHSDFVRFSDLLKHETALLQEWFAAHHFSRRKAVGVQRAVREAALRRG